MAPPVSAGLHAVAMDDGGGVRQLSVGWRRMREPADKTPAVERRSKGRGAWA